MTEIQCAQPAPDDGGPAFPACHFDLADNEHGMSLRDYFAAKAMQGMWANVEILKQLPDGLETKTVAFMAYEQADAMLKARGGAA